MVTQEMVDARRREAKRRADREHMVRADMASATAEFLANLDQSDADGHVQIDDVARSRSRVLAAKHNLARFGTVGEVVDYDPARHVLFGLSVPSGAPVRIARIGFDFTWGEAPAVALHAIVTPA